MGRPVTQAVEVKEDDATDIEVTDPVLERHRVALSLVKRHAAMAAGTGLVPVMGLDIVALTGIELNLISRLCDLYGVKFTRQAGLNVCVSLLAGMAPVALLTMTASLVKVVPVAGTLRGGNRHVGQRRGDRLWARPCDGQTFESGGNLLNFDSKKTKAYFREHVEAQRGPNPEWAKNEAERHGPHEEDQGGERK